MDLLVFLTRIFCSCCFLHLGDSIFFAGFFLDDVVVLVVVGDFAGVLMVGNQVGLVFGGLVLTGELVFGGLVVDGIFGEYVFGGLVVVVVFGGVVI